MNVSADWIAVDWGTSNVRAWAIGAGGEVLARAASERGMGRLSGAAEYEAALLDLASDWLHDGRATPVVVCGMAGARQGWIEAPYAAVPCRPVDPRRVVRAPTADPALDVTILHGLSQAEPPDVMRGEETQLGGLLAAVPGTTVACLPGTHTKWVRLEAGEVQGFATVMTGELFGLLAGQSVLRHSAGEGGWDDDAFDRAVRETLADPASVARRLFSVRAEALLAGLPAAAARARLSGLLIGLELASVRDWWAGADVAIVGSEKLARVYARALAAHGARPVAHRAEDMTLAGLAAARAALAGAA